MRKAIEQYNMIHENELICVGVSGGKDSMLLLKGLRLYQYICPFPYRLHAVCLDMGFKDSDFSQMQQYCDELEIPLTVKQTGIAPIIFEDRKEKNPCALCAKMRRGALHDQALELGSHKVALGHHADDFLETFYLSMFYEGRIHSFSPVTHLSRKNITSIRPMIYAREKDIIYAVNRNNIPVVKSKCPADGLTKREEMKNLIKEIAEKIPGSDERSLHAVKKFLIPPPNHD